MALNANLYPAKYHSEARTEQKLQPSQILLHPHLSVQKFVSILFYHHLYSSRFM